MRILIDAMGGDNAPGEIVRGAVEASREFHVDVTLAGRETEILACLNEIGVTPGEHIQVVNAPDVISMEDDPSTATRKNRSPRWPLHCRCCTAARATLLFPLEAPAPF